MKVIDRRQKQGASRGRSVRPQVHSGPMRPGGGGSASARREEGHPAEGGKGPTSARGEGGHKAKDKRSKEEAQRGITPPPQEGPIVRGIKTVSGMVGDIFREASRGPETRPAGDTSKEGATSDDGEALEGQEPPPEGQDRPRRSARNITGTGLPVGRLGGNRRTR